MAQKELLKLFLKGASPEGRPDPNDRCNQAGGSTACLSLSVLTNVLIGLVLLLALGFRYLKPAVERCPDCHALREEDNPICSCGWVFEYPDSNEPLEYGEDDTNGV